MSNGNHISVPDSRARMTFLLKTREHFILPKHIMSMGGPTRVPIDTQSAYSYRYLCGIQIVGLLWQLQDAQGGVTSG